MELHKKDEKNSEIKHLNRIISEKEEHIKNLDSELNEKNIILSRTKSYLFDLEYELNSANNKINSLESNLSKQEAEINSKENKINNINSKLNIKDNHINKLELELENNKKQTHNLYNQINSLKSEIKDDKTQESKFESNDQKYYHQLSKLDSKEYCIRCYKEQLKNNSLEIKYLKNNTLTKKLLNPISYLYLLFKSKPKEISINFKLYRALKHSDCFDVGYYLNKNKDINGSKWCKYFSPELHYVCNGFNEGREFNKKYFNKNSKKELLDYMLKCI